MCFTNEEKECQKRSDVISRYGYVYEARLWWRELSLVHSKVAPQPQKRQTSWSLTGFGTIRSPYMQM
jgi:hypothetical protein